jgi:hypothetical protein
MVLDPQDIMGLSRNDRMISFPRGSLETRVKSFGLWRLVLFHSDRVSRGEAAIPSGARYSPSMPSDARKAERAYGRRTEDRFRGTVPQGNTDSSMCVARSGAR